MKNIVNAGQFRRIGAAILDFLLALFVYILCAQFIFTPIANASVGYENAISDYSRYQIYSHLYIFIERDEATSQYTPVKVSEYNPSNTDNYTLTDLWSLPNYSLSSELDWTYYEGQVRYYYLSFLTGENLEKYSAEVSDADVCAPTINQTVVIDGTDTGKLPKDYYTLDWYYSSILKVGGESSPFVLTDGALALKEGQTNDNAYTFLMTMDYNIYYNAIYHFFYSDYFQSAYNTIITGQVVSFVPPFFLALILIYLIPPLIFKNGETLCKKMLNIGLLNVKEYSVTRVQVLLRQLMFIVEMTLSYFIIPIIFLTYNESNVFSYLATLGLGCFLLLIVTFFNEKKRTLHDFVALTFVIDTRKSVWFDDANQEARSEEQLEENLAKYGKAEETPSENLLQVGGQIIEENASRVLDRSEEEQRVIEATSTKVDDAVEEEENSPKVNKNDENV